MRRPTTVLLIALLGAGVGTVAAPPAAATGIAPRDLTITVTGLGTEQRTCSIDADLYLPPGASRHRPVPAVLATNGFGGTEATRQQVAPAAGGGRVQQLTLPVAP